MKITQCTLASAASTEHDLVPLRAADPQLLLVFGAVQLLADPGLLSALRAGLPQVMLAGCSTAGEIGAAADREGLPPEAGP